MPDFLYAGRIDPFLYVAWILVVGAAAVVHGRALRRAIVAKAPVPFAPALVLATPGAALILTTLAFTVGHGRPLAQYNDAGTMAWTRWWWAAWMPMLLGCAGGALVSFGCLVRDEFAVARGRPRPGGPAVWLLALVSNVVSLAGVFGNFPDA